MSIDPAALWAHALPIVLLTAVVVGGKLAGVTVGAFLAGNGLTTSVRAGLSLGQIGELSFILAGLGVATGAARGFVLPVLVGVSCLTALLAPLTARAAGPLATLIDSRLPRRVQTFVTFYGTWIEGIRAGRGRDTLWARVRRPVATLIIDTALLGATVVVTALYGDRAAALLGLGGLGRPLVLVAAALLSGLFLVGALRCARRLGLTLAAEVLPPSAAGKVDLGTAPRRALVLTLELAVVLVVGLPLVAFTLPFVPGGVLALGLLVGVIGFSVWRSITNLQGHVRAGSELIVETLARQSHAHTAPGLHEVKELLPGIPGLEPIRLPDGSPAVGRSLAQLNVRALTGATVLAIQRRDGGSVLPSASEVLQPGDVLALAGPKEAIEAAGKLLTG